MSIYQGVRLSFLAIGMLVGVLLVLAIPAPVVAQDPAPPFEIPPQPPNNPPTSCALFEFQLTSQAQCVCDCEEYSGILTDSGVKFANGQSAGVFLHTGEFFYNLPLLRIPGRGFDFSFTLSYRSGTNLAFTAGERWFYNHDYFLSVDPATGDVLAFDPERVRVDIYEANTDGTYTAPPGYFDELVRNEDDTFTILQSDGGRIAYTPPDANGFHRLAQLVDRHGNAMQFEYNSAGQLVQVTDTLGRPIIYEWGDDAKLDYIEDFSGRRVEFDYNEDQLAAIRSPAVTGTSTGNDFPQGKTTRFAYNDMGRLKDVYAPNEADGPPRVQITYAANGVSVESLTIGGTNASGIPAGGTITYAYGDGVSTSGTTVRDRTGAVTSYQFNEAGQITRIVNRTSGIRPDEPAEYETTYEYNIDGLIVSKTLPAGNRVEYSYDSQNSERRAQGNRLTETHIADAERSGDQQVITTTLTYEPIYNQIRTITDPRGTDPGHIPPNGGANSQERYTTTYRYDYEESCDAAAIGARINRSAVDVQALFQAAGICQQPLNDINGDGTTAQIAGNMIQQLEPAVTLLPDANLSQIEGATQQESISLYAHNQFGQLTHEIDPEGNVTEYAYYPERDPNGDSVIDNPGGDATTGGYLRQISADTTARPDRNSKTNPAPVNARTTFAYDAVGNIVQEVNARGVATLYEVNQLNQTIAKRSGVLDSSSGFVVDPPEVGALTDFSYVERFHYDANDNLVLHQVEDRGNTSNVDGNLPGSDADPAGGPAYSDTLFRYDMLDQPVAMVAEVANGASPEFLITRYRYDANQNRVLTIEPAGNAATRIYDERDLLLQTTTGSVAPPPAALMGASDPSDFDARGGAPSTIWFHIDRNGNVIEQVDTVDSDGSDENGSELLGSGDRTRFIYDGFDRRTAIVDSVGNQTVYQYDAAGNIVRELRFGPVGGASPTSDGPDSLPQPVSRNGAVQPANLVNGNLLAANETRYDERNRAYQRDHVLFVNTIPTQRAPDVADGAADVGKGDLTTSDAQPIPGVSGVTIIGRVSQRNEHDRNDRIVFIVEDDGDTARTFYDGMDRVVRTVDAENNTIVNAYDDNDNLIEREETDVAQTAGVPDEQFVTTYVYDSLDRPIRATDNLGQTTYLFYDSRNNLVARADAQGPLEGATITRRAFTGDGLTVNAINAPGNVTRYYYDGLNRRVREEQLLTASGTGDGSPGANVFGEKVNAPTVDNGQGGGDGLITTRYTYDANSLLSTLTDDNGNQTAYTYDNLNRRTEETKGNCVQPQIADRCDPPTTIAYGYDADSNLISITDENGSVTTYTYDGINRVIAARIDRAGGVVGTDARNYQYDGLSRRVRATDNNEPSDPSDDIVTTFAYDSLDRVIEEVQMVGNGPVRTASAAPSVVSSAWRAEDLRVDLTYPSGFQLTYRHDDLDRVSSIQGGSSQDMESRRAVFLPIVANDGGAQRALSGPRTASTSATETIEIAAYTYMGPYRVLQRSHGNSTQLTFLHANDPSTRGYDGMRRPVRLRHLRSDGTLIVGFTHPYDRMHNKRTEAKLHDPANSERYAYDSAYRLIDFQRGTLSANQESITVPSPNARQAENWRLDGAGNWSQFSYTDGGTTAIENRDHTSFNELYFRENGVAEDFEYDANGNLVEDGSYLYAWDAGNRLRAVTRRGETSPFAVYTYDAQNRRVGKVVANAGDFNGTTRFLYDGWRVLEERGADGVLQQQYIYGATYIDELIAMDRNVDGNDSATDPGDVRYYYHQNSRFSVFALTDANGVVREQHQYDAYGRATTIGSVGNPYRFTGRRYDGETGLHYYRHRYYSAELGRFLSRDSLGYVDSVNLYQYANHSPYKYSDPSGMKVTCRIVSIAVVIAGGAGATLERCSDECGNTATLIGGSARLGLDGGVGITQKTAPGCLKPFLENVKRLAVAQGSDNDVTISIGPFSLSFGEDKEGNAKNSGLLSYGAKFGLSFGAGGTGILSENTSEDCPCTVKLQRETKCVPCEEARRDKQCIDRGDQRSSEDKQR